MACHAKPYRLEATTMSWKSKLMFVTVLAALAHVNAAAEKDEVILFNGKNFDGWTAVIGKPDFKLEDIWSVADGGILVCKGKGKPPGYLRSTRDDFENYTLTLQWRFPAGTPGGNSGVLVHASTSNALGVWPKSLEAQRNHK